MRRRRFAVETALAALLLALAGCASVGGRGISASEKASSAATPRRGPSTADERAKAVRLAQELEKTPFSPRAYEDRRWLTIWLVEIPDLTVNICGPLLPLPRNSHPFEAEIFAQMLFAEAAFMIEHPDKAEEPEAVHLYGLESALRVYEKAFDRYPTANVAEMDHLISARDQGALPDYVRRTTAAGCRGRTSRF